MTEIEFLREECDRLQKELEKQIKKHGMPMSVPISSTKPIFKKIIHDSWDCIGVKGFAYYD